MRKTLMIITAALILSLCGCSNAPQISDTPTEPTVSETLPIKNSEEISQETDMYEVRHDDDQQGDPVQIANWIMVNHWGTLITNKPIRLEPSERINNAYRDIDPEEDWNYEGSVTTVKEYMEKNPPMVHKEKEQEKTR